MTIEEKVEKIAETFSTPRGIEIVDVEYVQDGGYWYVRIYIDKEDGITLENCEELSRGIEEEVDTVIDRNFFLEVSSPGIERPLKKPKDFVKYTGENAEIRTKHKFNNQKNNTGIIEKFENDIIYLSTKNGKIEIPLKEVERAKLAIDFEEELSRRDEE